MADEHTNPPATGLFGTVLAEAGVTTLAELAAKPIGEVMADLDRLSIPPSEAVLGALVLNAVHELHRATTRLDVGTSRLLSLTRTLAVLAALTLASAVVTLVVTIAK